MVGIRIFGFYFGFRIVIFMFFFFVVIEGVVDKKEKKILEMFS